MSYKGRQNFEEELVNSEEAGTIVPVKGDPKEYINYAKMAGFATMPSKSTLKDSGARETFSTGAQRDRQPGKGKPSLVPSWVIWLVSRVYEDGAVKYASRNWEKGMPLSQYIDSAERHMTKLKAGMRDEPHATQVIWNMIGYIYTATLIKMGLRSKELNDMPNQLAEIDEKGVQTAEPLSEYEYDSLRNFFDKEF